MAQWSLTELSSVTLLDRIDGEYYLPEYISNQSILSTMETVAVPQWFFVSDGNHLSVSKHFSDSGEIPYFRGQNVNDFFIENAEPIKIPRKVYDSPMMRRSHFFSGDVLLSIVGTIGSLSIVSETVGDATGSCKIAILRSRGDCSPFFLAAFLMSKFGQLQIKRNTRGAVQMGLILKDLSRIRVPKFSDAHQAQIETIVKKSLSVNRQSKKLYTQAQQLLESELGLDKLSFQKPVGYTARLSTLEQSRRLDAEYFDPVASSIVERISTFDHIRLGANCNVGNGFPWNSKKFLENNSGEPVVRIRNIRPSHIDVEELSSIDPKYARDIGFPKAKEGDIVVGMDGIKYFYASLIEGYCYVNQRVAHLTKHPGAKISQEYVTFIINSSVGQAQLLRDMTVATTVGHITNRNISNLLIPFVSDAFHRKITNLVKQSIDKKQESKRLLDQAKTRVEQLIEEAVQQ
jgi:restriction endonuclease S subunit